MSMISELGNWMSPENVLKRYGEMRAAENERSPLCPCGHSFGEHSEFGGWCTCCYLLSQPPCSGVAAIDNPA